MLYRRMFYIKTDIQRSASLTFTDLYLRGTWGNCILSKPIKSRDFWKSEFECIQQAYLKFDFDIERFCNHE